jgi:hypothetical protein
MKALLSHRFSATLALAVLACPSLYAAEHVTLRNGAEFDCARREPAGDRIRLYLLPTAHAGSADYTAETSNYIEVAATAVLRVDTVPDPPAPPTPEAGGPHLAPEMSDRKPQPATPNLTPAEMRQMLDRAGALHNVDADLLAAVVKAESNGNALAVSPAGARGLMQLMPATASDLGVANSFAPEQNIGGGTAYLDQLLARYRNDMKLALAAYNAGPAAVDRYHGIPPYAETRAYVARVISEFNRRKLAARAVPSRQIAASH